MIHWLRARQARRRERREDALLEALAYRMECTDPAVRARAEAEWLNLPEDLRSRA